MMKNKKSGTEAGPSDQSDHYADRSSQCDRAGGIRSASEAGGHFYIDRERNTVIYAESAELAEEISITIRKSRNGWTV